MVFICISGLFGLLSSRWSPEHIRHAIFTSLNGTKTANPTSTNRTQAPRKLFAKSIALLFFSTGLILTALAPIFFVLAVIVFEVFLLEYPQIERTDAVGAWGMFPFFKEKPFLGWKEVVETKKEEIADGE